jgi:hypothetical protein
MTDVQTVEQRLEALEAKAKADVSKTEAFITKAKAFIAAHYSKVIAAIVGYAIARFGILEAAFKLI